jgi:hypothetical protein
MVQAFLLIRSLRELVKNRWFDVFAQQPPPSNFLYLCKRSTLSLVHTLQINSIILFEIQEIAPKRWEASGPRWKVRRIWAHVTQPYLALIWSTWLLSGSTEGLKWAYFTSAELKHIMRPFLSLMSSQNWYHVFINLEKRGNVNKQRQRISLNHQDRCMMFWYLDSLRLLFNL